MVCLKREYRWRILKILRWCMTDTVTGVKLEYCETGEVGKAARKEGMIGGKKDENVRS